MYKNIRISKKQDQVISNVKAIIVLLYSVNLILFSILNFTNQISENKADFISKGYNRFLSKIHLRNVFSFLKLDIAYSFFGKGLHAGNAIEYTFYDRNGQKLIVTNLGNAFHSRNGNFRANSIATLINFNINYRLNRLEKNLLTLDSINDYKQWNIVRQKIKAEKVNFKESLIYIGKYIGRNIKKWKSFKAQFYYIVPQSNSLREHTTTLYLYKEIDFP